ncbi:MAG: DNA polymerase III subunit epsilon [Gammaproteobacteria bacterium]|nr:DNA polymerase III subunit epsilon [Gammaproteobacteria bacterium]MCY4312123.1 DNA polymerase III subunit epsilon [Gammaproteobacteria bacterium]
MRQVVLDTETTGLEVGEGHRIVEIGAVELLNRHVTDRKFHKYIDPERDISKEASQIHGITSERLAGSPVFRDIADEFLEFVGDSDLIIHNATFDIGFLNNELALTDSHADEELQARCQIIDTLDLARNKHPGQRNDLDSLCQRYGVNNSSRALHGALLDAELLALVYLQMTGGQATLLGEQDGETSSLHGRRQHRQPIKNADALIRAGATSEDLQLHEKWLDMLRQQKQVDGEIIWDRVSNPASDLEHGQATSQ